MPLSKRQIYARRRIAVFGGALLVLGTAFYLPFTLLAPLHTLVATVQPYPTPAVTAAELTFPEYGASGLGAIGYSGVLASAGSTEPLPIASISKVITALVVLDAKPLAVGESGPEITFGEVDRQFYEAQLADGGSVSPVSVGQTISQRNALDVMLLRSANNYAESLAVWAFGSEAAFVTATQAWLVAHGLTGTTILEPSGVNPGNTSTVANLIEVARIVHDEPVVSQIVATSTMDVPGIGPIQNSNALLGIDGVDGIKTGTLDEAGSCLLFSQQHQVGGQTVTLIGVVLGGPDHETINAAIQSLLAQADAGFQEVTLATAGQPFAEYDTPWGTTATAIAASTVTAAVWTANPVTADLTVHGIQLAPRGQTVGEAKFTVGQRTFSVPLALSSAIEDPGPWWRLGNPTKLF